MDDRKEKQLIRYQKFFQILDEWMSLKERDKDIDDILFSAGYKKIAVYGMGRMCAHICSHLADSPVELAYIIDKQMNELYDGIQIYDLKNNFEAVDAVIYTDTEVDNDILTQLKEKLKGDIISLADVVFDNLPVK